MFAKKRARDLKYKKSAKRAYEKKMVRYGLPVPGKSPPHGAMSQQCNGGHGLNSMSGMGGMQSGGGGFNNQMNMGMNNGGHGGMMNGQMGGRGPMGMNSMNGMHGNGRGGQFGMGSGCNCCH